MPPPPGRFQFRFRVDIFGMGMKLKGELEPWGAKSKVVAIFEPQTGEEDNFSANGGTKPKFSGCFLQIKY